MRDTGKKDFLVPLVCYILLILLMLLAGHHLAHADISQLQRRTGPPVHELTCQEQLSNIRDSMFRATMGEAILAKQLGNQDQFNWFLSRARYVRHTPDLKPSPTTCDAGNIKTLNIMAASWWYDYVLDQAALFKLENQ